MSGEPAQPQRLAITDHRVLVLTSTVILLVVGLTLGHQALPDLRLEASQGSDGIRGLTAPTSLRSIELDTVIELERTFQETDFDWPPGNTIPALAVKRFPKGIDELDVNARKALFFRTLVPLIVAENSQLRYKRQQLLDIFARGNLHADDPAYALATEIATRYRVEGDLNDADVRAALLRRVDEIPASLALAQAANESGWGTSRFVREANNIFGVWTWEEDAGLVPEQRPEGETYLIRVFPDLQSSVRNYLLTLNIGAAYRQLRSIRADMRRNGNELNGLRLAEGLASYSERGEDYVEEVRSMIRTNQLHELDELTFGNH
ncbi:MAG: glucosaminidase domain-containing protein [Aquisalimonadaceae bacterium]